MVHTVYCHSTWNLLFKLRAAKKKEVKQEKIWGIKCTWCDILWSLLHDINVINIPKSKSISIRCETGEKLQYFSSPSLLLSNAVYEWNFISNTRASFASINGWGRLMKASFLLVNDAKSISETNVRNSCRRTFSQKHKIY